MLPSAAIVVVFVLGDVNPSYVLTSGVIVESVVPVKFSVSAISYPSNVIFCF